MENRLDKTRRRKEVIVEAAVDCFATKGFHQSSMRDIATRAGVSLGNLYNHFPSKSELITEIARLEALDMKSLLDLLEGEGEPLDLVVKALEGIWADCRDPYIARLSLEIMAEASRNKDIYRLFENNREKIISAIARKLQQITNTETDQKYFAAAIVDMVEAAALREAVAENQDSTQTFEDLKPAILKLIT